MRVLKNTAGDIVLKSELPNSYSVRDIAVLSETNVSALTGIGEFQRGFTPIFPMWRGHVFTAYGSYIDR